VNAVAESAAQPFDVVLMDMNMPVMDGVTATRHIRALPKPFCDIPIIGVSADALPHERERYLQAGLNDYVTKPIQWQILYDAMLQHVKSAGVFAA
jgi:CheY-like chemotaxis protein